ncbi:MAG TPA: GlsB/YeaQ/YmgE family stress response membrane protein [Stellaceae bacterium]|nr:GlsB/YeaQ/YmgE family stress response membrane protein [Stellaceae bacterium]
MSGESLLVILFVGLVAGWLAGQVVSGTGFGIIGDLVVGVIGALIGDWLLPRVGIAFGAGIVAAIVDATIGAIVLLLVVKLVRGGSGWQGNSWGRRWGGWGSRRWGHR